MSRNKEINKPPKQDKKLMTHAPRVIETSVKESEGSAKIGIFLIINS